MLPFRKKGCVEFTHIHKMKLEEKRAFSGFCGTNGEQPILWIGVLEICFGPKPELLFAFFFQQKKGRK